MVPQKAGLSVSRLRRQGWWSFTALWNGLNSSVNIIRHLSEMRMSVREVMITRGAHTLKDVSPAAASTELICIWFRFTRSISGVKTTGVPFAEESLYKTCGGKEQRPQRPVRHIALWHTFWRTQHKSHSTPWQELISQRFEKTNLKKNKFGIQ